MKTQMLTNGIVHADFNDFRALVTRKKGWYKLDRKTPRSPTRHHTIKRWNTFS